MDSLDIMIIKFYLENNIRKFPPELIIKLNKVIKKYRQNEYSRFNKGDK